MNGGLTILFLKAIRKRGCGAEEILDSAASPRTRLQGGDLLVASRRSSLGWVLSAAIHCERYEERKTHFKKVLFDDSTWKRGGCIVVVGRVIPV
jgi:hypothetical protein